MFQFPVVYPDKRGRFLGDSVKESLEPSRTVRAEQNPVVELAGLLPTLSWLSIDAHSAKMSACLLNRLK